MVPYGFIKNRAAKSSGFSIDKNTAMKQDRHVQPGCSFINPVCTVIIGIPASRYHFKAVKTKITGAAQVLACVFKRGVDYRKTDQPVSMAGDQPGQMLIGRPQRISVIQCVATA